MKPKNGNIPSEEQIQRLLESVPPELSGRVETRLALAPWTPRGASRRRLTWIIPTAFAAIFVLFFASPPGRAWAQNVFQFFRQASSDKLPLEPWQMTAIANYKLTTTPVIVTMTPGSEPGYTFDLSVEEAGQKAGFQVLIPAFVIDTLIFDGASYEPDKNIVRLHFRHTDYADIPNGLTLREERYQTNDDCGLCGLVGASQAIEKVFIGDIPGEYIEGVWTLTENGPSGKGFRN